MNPGDERNVPEGGKGPEGPGRGRDTAGTWDTHSGGTCCTEGEPACLLILSAHPLDCFPEGTSEPCWDGTASCSERPHPGQGMINAGHGHGGTGRVMETHPAHLHGGEAGSAGQKPGKEPTRLLAADMPWWCGLRRPPGRMVNLCTRPHDDACRDYQWASHADRPRKDVGPSAGCGRHENWGRWMIDETANIGTLSAVGTTKW